MVEILVVVAIVGILAVIAIPNFLDQERKAVDLSIKTDLRTIATQLQTLAQADGAVGRKAARLEFKAPKLTLGEESVTMSPGNNPRIFLNDTDGVCIQVTNPDGSDPVRGYIWKADAGGLQPAGQTCAGYDTVAV
jgi:type IV pilus assembly protein PilA